MIKFFVFCWFYYFIEDEDDTYDDYNVDNDDDGTMDKDDDGWWR